MKPRLCYVCAKPREGVHLLCIACADRMKPKTKTYNPRNVRVSVGGQEIRPYTAGEVIKADLYDRLPQWFAPRLCANYDTDTGEKCAMPNGHLGSCCPF